MGTIHRIDDPGPRKPVKKAGAICYCDVRHAADQVIKKELAELRQRVQEPEILCLESLKSGIPAKGAGWDLIYSCCLLAELPSVAARQVVRTAVTRLKSGGRLLMANLRCGLAVEVCTRCRQTGKNQREEDEMAELTQGVSLSIISGQIIFYDPSGLNVFLELHRTHVPGGSRFGN